MNSYIQPLAQQERKGRGGRKELIKFVKPALRIPGPGFLQAVPYFWGPPKKFLPQGTKRCCNATAYNRNNSLPYLKSLTYRVIYYVYNLFNNYFHFLFQWLLKIEIAYFWLVRSLPFQKQLNFKTSASAFSLQCSGESSWTEYFWILLATYIFYYTSCFYITS